MVGSVVGSIRVEFANLRDEMHRGFACGDAGTMLAVMAHGFQWI
jgi:hypothetical protein